MSGRKRKWIVSGCWDEYLEGVNEFVEFAFRDNKDENVPYPCKKCVNRFRKSKEEIIDHLVVYRMVEDYDTWFCHGESLSTSAPGRTSDVEQETGGNDDDNDNVDDVMEMLYDVFSAPNQAESMNIGDEGIENATTSSHPDVEKFKVLMKDADTELYPGCKKFSRLSFLLHLYHIKIRFGWSNKSSDDLLKLLKDAFPEGVTLPGSERESQKVIDVLGLKYEKIDACPNDCMLFWKDKIDDQKCSVCSASRWKEVKKNSGEVLNATCTKKKKKRIPAKVLRYFPVTPRLQRLYMSTKTASDMTWHKKECNKDNDVLRHPADCEAWKKFDDRYPEFAAEPRNVRMGLASDGFNPFGRLDSRYSIWPVILIPYNLPPWLCMKRENFILSMIIPGPRAPGNDIDVYLQPLIDELNELWEKGVSTYDASTEQVFQMHATLTWTINDYPALGNLSGWNIYGKFGCVSCNINTCSIRLKYGNKFSFMGHQRFLDDVTAFKGPPSGSEVLEQVKDIHFIFGKLSDPATGVPEHTWKKLSIFFELPYWKHIPVRHNLDVMHIEKNVCDNMCYTYLNHQKSKDNLKARRDLKRLKIRKKLWPQRRGQSGRIYLPPACFTMSNEAQQAFCDVLMNVKFPDGYASNISRCIQKRSLSGLKSHDCHVLMQCILPVALRGNLDDKVASVVGEFCGFFRVLCGKTLRVHELDLLEAKIPRVLCCLEKIFLPSFFTVMVHLVIHLAYEARVAGPVHYRWMYPIERFLKVLKSFVRNKARPEGSIAEAYLAEECLTFSSRYLKGVEPRNKSRNNANIDFEGDKESYLFPVEGKPYGSIQGFKMDDNMWKQTHRYVLFNCKSDEIDSLKRDHKAHINRIMRKRRPSLHEKDRLHSEGFSDWLKAYVKDPANASDERITSDVKLLARGPNHIARRFKAFDVNNGYRFRTREYEKDMSTQNSGVMVVAKTQSYASSSDTRPICGDVVYYGRLVDIVELDYYGDLKVVLFRCDWVDVTQGTGIKSGSGFTLVNFQHLIHKGDRVTDEPFVFPSQAQQVIYVQDCRDREWFVPLPMQPRDTYDLGVVDFEGTMLPTGNESHMVSVQGASDGELDEISQVMVEGTYVDDDHIEDTDEDDSQ